MVGAAKPGDVRARRRAQAAVLRSTSAAGAVGTIVIAVVVAVVGAVVMAVVGAVRVEAAGPEAAGGDAGVAGGDARAPVSLQLMPAAETGPATSLFGNAVELDARAAAVMAIRPTDLGDGFALMDLLSGIFPAVVGGFDRARDSAGLYSFSRSELLDRGADAEALVLATWGQIDADDWPMPKGRHRAGPPKPVWARHRVVVKIAPNLTNASSDADTDIDVGRKSDPGKSDAGKPGGRNEDKLEAAFTQALLKRGATIVKLPHAKGMPAEPPWAKKLAKVAKRAAVRFVARTASGDLISLRLREGRAVIDWAELWEGRLKPTDELDVVFAKMVAPPRRRVADELGRSPRPLLASRDSSISVVLSPAAIAALDPNPACRDEWSSGDGALLDEAAVLLRMHPFDWKLEVVWTLTPLGQRVFGGAAADDGLVDGKAIVHNGLAAAGLWVSSLDGVVAALEPRLKERLRRAIGQLPGAVPDCGASEGVIALGRYWPQLARMVVDDSLPMLGAAPAEARPRNVAALLAEPSGSGGAAWLRHLTYFVSFPQSAAGALERTLSVSGTKGERQTFGDRTPTFFDFGNSGRFEEAALETLAGGHVGMAVSPPGNSLGWYYRMRRRPARFGAQSNVGFLQVNLARLLARLASASDAGTQAAVKLAASQFGSLGGNLAEADGTLHLDLALAPP